MLGLWLYFSDYIFMLIRRRLYVEIDFHSTTVVVCIVLMIFYVYASHRMVQ